jgi:hypothetical protein
VTIPSRKLWAYLEEEVTRSEAAEIDALLDDSASERRRLDRLRRVRDALAAPDPELEGVDLVSAVRREIEDRAPAREERPRPVLRWRLAAAAGLACLLVAVAIPLWRWRTGTPGEGEFVARSAAPGQLERDRWVGVKCFHVDPRGGQHPLGRQLPAGSGLLFAYTNLGPEPKEHLMIFAVDGSGRIFWFYPAYERLGTNPSALRIKRRVVDVELPHLVRHDLAPGPLVIYSLFTEEPVRVLEIEALVGDLFRSGQWSITTPGRIPVPGSGQQILRTEVVR